MAENPDQLTRKNRWRRSFLRAVGRVLYRLFARVEISGLEHVPQNASYLVAINHVSSFEPPVVVSHWPATLEVLGAVEVWREPDKAFLARNYGGIPIDRDHYDRAAVEQVICALQAGCPVLIAPEGRLTFKPGLRQAKLGIAYLAQQAHVPVIPAGVVGCGPDFLRRVIRGQRPRVRILIGSPIHLPDINKLRLARKEAYRRNADRIMAHLASLLPEDYRGYYADYTNLIETTD